MVIKILRYVYTQNFTCMKIADVMPSFSGSESDSEELSLLLFLLDGPATKPYTIHTKSRYDIYAISRSPIRP